MPVLRMEIFSWSKQSYYPSLLIIFTLAFFCIANICLAVDYKPNQQSTNDFIKASCGITLYPDICYKTLSVYASTIQKDPTQLANAALSVTLQSAQNTTNVVLQLLKSRNLKPREAGAIKDCVETMEDSVDELQQSLVAMSGLEGPNFEMQMSNIQTWVSAALTDENTCMDGFEEHPTNGNIKGIIRSHVVTVAELTSNALALINELS